MSKLLIDWIDLKMLLIIIDPCYWYAVRAVSHWKCYMSSFFRVWQRCCGKRSPSSLSQGCQKTWMHLIGNEWPSFHHQFDGLPQADGDVLSKLSSAKVYTYTTKWNAHERWLTKSASLIYFPLFPSLAEMMETAESIQCAPAWKNACNR